MNINEKDFKCFMEKILTEYEKMLNKVMFYKKALDDLKENKKEVDTIAQAEILASYTAYLTAAESYSRLIGMAKILFNEKTDITTIL